LNTCCCFQQAGAVEIKTNIQNSKFDTSKLMSCRGQKLVPKCRSEYIKKEYFEFTVRRVSYLTKYTRSY
jgi:hypothetical protein